jgi:hypothetical protein
MRFSEWTSEQVHKVSKDHPLIADSSANLQSILSMWRLSCSTASSWIRKWLWTWSERGMCLDNQQGYVVSSIYVFSQRLLSLVTQVATR